MNKKKVLRIWFKEPPFLMLDFTNREWCRDGTMLWIQDGNVKRFFPISNIEKMIEFISGEGSI
jgi:hypothetical protein